MSTCQPINLSTCKTYQPKKQYLYLPLNYNFQPGLLMKTNGQLHNLANPRLWAIFFLYIIISGFTILHHELWGDEIHSWNIAKASGNLSDLISNSRYEGHPPAWYIILWLISKFTNNPAYIQLVQFMLACSVVFLVLFYSPFPFLTRALIPFGYFFLFEYGVLSRNYAIGLLPAFCICVLLGSTGQRRLILYYILLFFMSNTHLLALILAGSMHIYFLLSLSGKNKPAMLFRHLVWGLIILLPAVYFIFPPSDSGLSVDSLVNKWDIHQAGIVSRAPLRAFVPIPAWWNYHFWNTQFILELQNKYSVLRFISPFLSLLFLVLAFLILKNNKKCLILFTINVLLTFVIAIVFPLTAARYTGFIFIGFIIACWLHYYEIPLSRNKSRMLNLLLVLQLIASINCVYSDIRWPFSNASRIKELLQKIPAHEKAVTDIGCVNNLSAFADTALYCIGPDRPVSFVQWNHEFKLDSTGSYVKSIKKLFQKEGINKVYLVSIYPPQIISRLDPQLENSFRLLLIDKIEGSIEKWSNLYLYEIRSLQ